MTLKPLKIAALLALLSAFNASSAAEVVFDNVSLALAQAPGATIAYSSGNYPYYGDVFYLAKGTTGITGFDLFPANASQFTILGVQVTINIWDTVNGGTVNARNPVFSNLLGTYTFNSARMSLASGQIEALQGTSPGVTPYFTLPQELKLSDREIGISINYNSTVDGTNYSNFRVGSAITYGAAPTVGQDLMNGLYILGGTSDGNFTRGGSSFGNTLTNQGLAVRIYGVSAVPEPGTYAMLLAGLGLVAWRARRAAAA